MTVVQTIKVENTNLNEGQTSDIENLNPNTTLESEKATKWKEIWNKRTRVVNVPKESNLLNLQHLIALNGFESGAGKINVEDYQQYAKIISEKIQLQEGHSVYEVGCGSGAFLYALGLHSKHLKVGGIDYSIGLLESAKKVFPHGDFECRGAHMVEPCNTYDYVISNSVFQYFDDHYAKQVLQKMLAKAERAVCILDIPDAMKEEESEKIRRAKLSPEVYKTKYSGLHHNYYSRDWFANIANQEGLKYHIFDGCVPNYGNNPFRFGCLIWK